MQLLSLILVFITIQDCVKQYLNNIVRSEIIHEASIIANIPTCPGLPTFFGVLVEDKPYTMITTYFGELRKPAANTLRYYYRLELTVAQCFQIALKLVEVVIHLHKHKFIHNDLKFDNILIQRKQNIGLCVIDFGLAEYLTSSVTHKKIVYTDEIKQKMKNEPQIAPEVILNGPYSFESDIYAVGYCLGMYTI